MGRDPGEIKRSVQVRLAGGLDELRGTTEELRKVGVTEFLLILAGDDPVPAAEHAADLLPRLRELG